MLRGILRRENPIGGAPLQRGVDLKWFHLLSRRQTFVGGYALYRVSALLVTTKKDREKRFAERTTLMRESDCIENTIFNITFYKFD